ncbi:MAG: endo alpha-1,4 polygalactosaminidase, partial [Deltaproteobacteria bacterium]|nr:endo alpha-1,4 polygalactosaminidase [Deltaproteobacteria bacterium]
SGVYLDIIDGYEYWREQRGARRRASAATDMARLVIALARYARETRGRSDFIVIPQNGSGILEYLSPQLRTQYRAAIDGIGAEDTFYFGDEDENNPLALQTGVIENLGQFRDAGKPVFSIDYLTEPLLIESYKGLACSNGFIPQVSVRALDRFETNTLAGCDD